MFGLCLTTHLIPWTGSNDLILMMQHGIWHGDRTKQRLTTIAKQLVERIYPSAPGFRPICLVKPKLARHPCTLKYTESVALYKWGMHYNILADSSTPCSLPRLPFVAVGHLAIIFSCKNGKRHCVRVSMVVCCAVQHATPHSTAKHPCALQYNASQV